MPVTSNFRLIPFQFFLSLKTCLVFNGSRGSVSGGGSVMSVSGAGSTFTVVLTQPISFVACVSPERFNPESKWIPRRVRMEMRREEKYEKCSQCDGARRVNPPSRCAFPWNLAQSQTAGWTKKSWGYFQTYLWSEQLHLWVCCDSLISWSSFKKLLTQKEPSLISLVSVNLFPFAWNGRSSLRFLSLLHVYVFVFVHTVGVKCPNLPRRKRTFSGEDVFLLVPSSLLLCVFDR